MKIKSRKMIRSVIVIVFALLFCACGKEAEVKNMTAQGQVEEQKEKVVTRWEKEAVTNLLSDKWKRNDISNENGFLAFSEYYTNVFKKNQDGKRFPRGKVAYKNCIYSLDTYYDDTVLNYINIYDGNTRKMDTLKYEGQYVFTFDVISGRLFGMSMEFDEEGDLDECFLIEFLEKGKSRNMANLCSILEEHNLLPGPYYGVESRILYEPENDCFYIISPDKRTFIKADSEGNEVFSVDSLAELNGDDMLTGKGFFEFFTSTDEGNIIFNYSEGKNSYLFIMEGDKARVLFCDKSGPESLARFVSVDEHNKIMFFYDDTTVALWDTLTGSMERVYIEIPEGSYAHTEIDCVVRNSNGELIVSKGDNVCIFTDNGPTENVELEVCSLGFIPGNIKDGLKKYQSTHPGVTFKFRPEIEWDGRESKIAQIFSEIERGEGPDILVYFYYGDDIYNMEKNNGLLDLTGMLAPDTVSKLIPEVMESASLDGKVTHLPYEANLRSFYVKKEYWNKESWNIKDLLDTLDAGNENGEPFDYIVLGTGYDNPFYAFSESMIGKEFIDFEKGVANYDSELLVRFLNTFKAYNDKNAGGSIHQDEGERLFLKGKALLYHSPITTFFDYSRLMNKFGPDVQVIGCPDKEGLSIAFANGIAINKNTKHADVIKDILNCMYTPDYLLSHTVPIRKDVYEGRIEDASDNDYFKGQMLIRLDSYSFISAETKADGSNYLDEYFGLLDEASIENGAPLSDQVLQIVYDEVEPFFAGARSAEETAKIIQSRVSLFLMENY